MASGTAFKSDTWKPLVCMYIEPTEGNWYTLVIEATERNWYILVIEATEVNWYVLVLEDISIL